MDADGGEHPPALLRPGPRLVPDGAEQRPRALHALGVHRHAALLHAAAVPHEPRRHRPDGVLRQQLATGPTRSSTPGRSPAIRPRSSAIVSGHHGVPRMGELVAVRPGPGPPRGRRRGPADPRLRQEGRAGHRRRAGQRLLAQVPAPLPAERQVLPRLAASPTPDRPWGIYLVDVFDNMLLLREEPGYALFEPMPLRPTPAAAGDPRPGRPRAATTPWST